MDPSGTNKVPRLNMHRSILSLSKISHEMWHDHPAKEKGQQKEQWEWGF